MKHLKQQLRHLEVAERQQRARLLALALRLHTAACTACTTRTTRTTLGTVCTALLGDGGELRGRLLHEVLRLEQQRRVLAAAVEPDGVPPLGRVVRRRDAALRVELGPPLQPNHQHTPLQQRRRRGGGGGASASVGAAGGDGVLVGAERVERRLHLLQRLALERRRCRRVEAAQVEREAARRPPRKRRRRRVGGAQRLELVDEQRARGAEQAGCAQQHVRWLAVDRQRLQRIVVGASEWRRLGVCGGRLRARPVERGKPAEARGTQPADGR